MTSWFNTSSIVPQWKTFIASFQTAKQSLNIRPQQISFTLQPQQLPSLQANVVNFLSSVKLMLDEIKSQNYQMTDFVRQNAPLLINEAIKMVLQVPQTTDSAQRKNRYPLQSIEFIQGLMYLPNIFRINLLKQQLYIFYCKAIFYYFSRSLSKLHQRKHQQEYQNAIYKNYFLRLFELPYAVVECQTRTGVNYASITMSMGSSASMSVKRQSFLQCLISTLQKSPQYLDMIITNISSESLLTCLSKILMTNGMYNYPFMIKEQVLKKLFMVKKKYIEFVSNFMNAKLGDKQFIQLKEDIEVQVENILELQYNIVKNSSNIYDGIKLFETVGHIDNVKDVVYLASVNVVWTNRNPNNQALVSAVVQRHLTELLLMILAKDNQLYKSSSPSIELHPKINLLDINASIQPLILSLKQLLSQKPTKIQTKHLNLVKILYVMILNRQKYDIIDTIVIKHSILCLLVDICKKYHQMDILINSVMEIFRSIFRGQVNLLILPANTPNLQDYKLKHDVIDEKLTAQAFKACDMILALIKGMKSHKDPMFGHFFKLAKAIKQFSRNFFSSIESSIQDQMSLSQSIQSSVSLNYILEPMYKNDFIKSKCKEWQDFYITNFIQLETNYLRDLGKFEQFDKAPAQPETQFTVVRFGQQKDITQSQVIHDKAEIEASMKNSIEILSMKRDEQQLLSQPIQISTTALNFKKDKNSKETKISDNQSLKSQLTTVKPISAQLITKQEIEITSQPIKIEFKRKKIQNLEQAETDSATQEQTVEESENKFQNFMKKQMKQVGENRENMRKKSKTPTKFKSTDDKTPPKMKKWGISQPQQASKNTPKELTATKHKSQTEAENSKNLRNLSADDKFSRLKAKWEKEKPLKIKLIKVQKLPPVYKQRDLDSLNRDSRLMAWLRG